MKRLLVIFSFCFLLSAVAQLPPMPPEPQRHSDKSAMTLGRALAREHKLQQQRQEDAIALEKAKFAHLQELNLKQQRERAEKSAWLRKKKALASPKHAGT